MIWTTNRKNELFVIYFLWSRDFKTASFFYYSFNLCFFLALFYLDCLSYQTKLHKMKINQYFLWYLFSKFFKLNWRYWKNMYGSAKSSLFNLSHTKYEIVFKVAIMFALQHRCYTFSARNARNQKFQHNVYVLLPGGEVCFITQHFTMPLTFCRHDWLSVLRLKNVLHIFGCGLFYSIPELSVPCLGYIFLSYI